MKPFATLAAPIAAFAFGALPLSALALGACNNDDEILADNSYPVPSERDGPNESLSGYPAATPSTPATPAPGTLGNPDTSSDTTPPPILPPNPDDPVQRPPGSPPTPLP